MSTYNYDAILFVSFGGPEKKEDVIPFLENVLRGKPVPRERMLEVAEHYYHFDGVSPINAQNRELIDAVTSELKGEGIDIPVYWGNRNWHPMLNDTMTQMKDDGVKKAIAFFTSAYSSYSGCRQYRENVLECQTNIGEGAPQVNKIRTFFNHPDFIEANADRVKDAIDSLSKENQADCRIAFTAHSIPISMSKSSDYVKQLTEACRLVAAKLGISNHRWSLVYQSRSGRPEDPWLEPDILDHLKEVQDSKTKAVVISPIGFLCDHMEIMFDLDEEAADLCKELNLEMVRAGSAGVHPSFVRMVCKLIKERLLNGEVPRESIGQFPPNWDVCPENCCPAPQRREASKSS